ncbi:prepilin-type N-terminal cleavage/methylation domain-containing protein [Massilia sp. H-1]|nr:prepilin-type N-terminal cleavage/methylation domain-containing protein [Massilia sp. H-1]
MVVGERAMNPWRQRGLTLVELMVAAALGLLVVLIAISMLLSSNRAWLAQVQAASVDDAARFALASIERAARQGAYVEWERGDAASDPDPGAPPAVRGLDAASLSLGRACAHRSASGLGQWQRRAGAAFFRGGRGRGRRQRRHLRFASPWGPGRKAGAFSMSA